MNQKDVFGTVIDVLNELKIPCKKAPLSSGKT